jgi:predicted ester cyclase
MDVTGVIGRYLDALSARDLTAIAGCITDDVEYRGAFGHLDRSGYLDLLKGLFVAFPDWSFEHGRLRFGWDHATIELRMHGTHTGPLVLDMLGLQPSEPTGRVVVLPPQDVHYTVRDRLVWRIEPVAAPGAGLPGILEQIEAPVPSPF